jgi:hypothetical protein
MTITTTRIKLTRIASHHLRASNSPCGFASFPTAYVLKRIGLPPLTLLPPPLTVTVTAITTNLAAATATTVAKAAATALALTNATTTLFWLVVVSPHCLRCGTLLMSASSPIVWVAVLLSALSSVVCVIVRCLRLVWLLCHLVVCVAAR